MYEVVQIVAQLFESGEWPGIPSEESFATGYAVMNVPKRQLESLHVLTLEEAREICGQRQEAALIRENWPDPDDPEVVALINDQTFVPEGQINIDVLTSPVYRLHMAAETIARKRAGLAPINPSNLGEPNG